MEQATSFKKLIVLQLETGTQIKAMKCVGE